LPHPAGNPGITGSVRNTEDHSRGEKKKRGNQGSMVREASAEQAKDGCADPRDGPAEGGRHGVSLRARGKG